MPKRAALRKGKKTRSRVVNVREATVVDPRSPVRRHFFGDGCDISGEVRNDWMLQISDTLQIVTIVRTRDRSTGFTETRLPAVLHALAALRGKTLRLAVSRKVRWMHAASLQEMRVSVAQAVQRRCAPPSAAERRSLQCGSGNHRCRSDQSKTGLSTPRILCSLGEVVVYCMWIFLSGKIYGAAPNAARAASWKPDKISFFLPG